MVNEFPSAARAEQMFFSFSLSKCCRQRQAFDEKFLFAGQLFPMLHSRIFAARTLHKFQNLARSFVRDSLYGLISCKVLPEPEFVNTKY